MKTRVYRRYRPICAIASLLILAAASALFAGPQIYKSNVQTAQHVAVAGTHVALVPPPGAKAAKDFRGFELASRNIRIEIVERMGVPYAESEGTLTAAGLESEGIKLLDTTKVTLNENPAVLLQGTMKPRPEEGVEEEYEEIGVLLLVLGDSKLTASLYGYYPLSDKSAATVLRNSLLSAIFQSEQSARGRDGYTISSEGTAFRFSDEANSTKYYTIDGAPMSSEVQSAVFTATALSQAVPAGQRTQFAEKTLERYLSEYEYTVASTREVAYGGLSGIELVADFDGAIRRTRTASGGTVRRAMPGKGYQTMLFDNKGRVYVFSGIAVRDSDSYLSQFIKITSTFTLTK